MRPISRVAALAAAFAGGSVLSSEAGTTPEGADARFEPAAHFTVAEGRPDGAFAERDRWSNDDDDDDDDDRRGDDDDDDDDDRDDD